MPTAETQVHDPAAAAPPATAPPAEATPPAQETAKGKRGRKPSDSPDSEQITFWQELEGFSEQDWETRVIYMYRWQPYYDNTKGGTEPKYVRLFNSAVTIDDIKRQDGSGKYNLKLNQTDPARKTSRTVREVVFDIVDPEYPPNLPPGDWQRDPRNSKWVWSKQDGAPAPGTAGAAAPGGGGIQSIKDVKALIETIYPDLGKTQRGDSLTAEIVKILPALLEQKNAATQQLDPMAMVTNMVALIKAMVPPPAAATGPDPMTAFLLKQIESMNANTAALQKHIFDLLSAKNDAAKPADPLDQVKSIVSMITAVTDAKETLGGAGAASRMNGWQEVASNVGTELIKHVGPILPAMLAPKPAPRPVPQQQQRQLPAAPGQAAPNPAQAPQPTAAAAAPPEPAGAEAQQDPQAVMEEADMNTASFIAGKIHEYSMEGPILTYFNDGENGLSLAIWIVDGHGAMPLNMLKSQGKETLARAISQYLPDLYTQLAPSWPKFLVFLDEFLSWTPGAGLPEQDDDEEDDEPEPITTQMSAPAATAPPAPAETPAPSTPKKAAAKKKAAPKVKK